MAATSAEIEEFLTGPLVTWLGTCVKKPEALQVYESFFDGSPINEVLLQIDPEPAQPVPTLSSFQGLSIIASRIKIFHCIIRNIKSIYENELEQLVVALPDCVIIGRAPASRDALEQLKLLILLLLGCAVQGPTKEVFITRITELSLEAQHDIVECIKQVTDDQSVVLTHGLSEQLPEKLYEHLRALAIERDLLFQHWVTDLGQDLPASTGGGSVSDGFETNHMAVELADWKAKLRKLRQELEEKTEYLTECKEELEHANSIVSKLKTENADLLLEARKAKALRDEVDAMRDRAERVERLEAEAQRYRERLADTDFYRVRVNELREDNRVLLETREMLETQLARARQRADHVMDLEAELLACKQTINDISLERDAEKDKVQELLDENLNLQQVVKSALQESHLQNTFTDSEHEESNSGDNSLSEQLTNNAQARALKLELENRKLLSTIDSLKEHNFHESSKKILDLEKEKKKLELKLEQLSENMERLKQQNHELDDLFKDSIQENKKLQSTLDTGKMISDRQVQDLQNERLKVEELEKNLDALTKEKQRVQALCDTIKRRADEAEKSLTHMTEQLQNAQIIADKSKEHEKLGNDLLEKVAILEKENSTAQKEIVKFKEILEVKDRKIDEQLDLLQRQEKENARLTKETEGLTLQLEKLQDCEQKCQELLSQAAIHVETISTLQKDLVIEKVANDKCRQVLEKVGLNTEFLEYDVRMIIEKMFENSDFAETLMIFAKERNPEEVKCMTCSNHATSTELLAQTAEVVKDEWSARCEKLSSDLSALQLNNQMLQKENAKMQVNISTLSSQISSLQTQQTALQLANSQLVAEKEELVKQIEIKKNKHDTLLLDQVTMRTLHDQLNSEYEELKKDQELLKKTNRDVRIEVRTLKETSASLEKKICALEQEKEALKNESKSLSNLRTEHSKLKDDFRNLFTANDRLKTEYRGLQEENKVLRTESSRLRLGNTEMQGELNTRSDLLNGLQVENAKLQQRCDILFEMNHSLDTDRRALMDHVSKLLSQYHSLLLHSLDDKKHYHLEEKMFTDKLNNLCRQKEKLEEKIMEHYRKLDNASAKKRGFGATLVRRVMNKIPRNRRSWHEDTQRLTQSQFTLGTGSGESGGNDSDNSTEESHQKTETFKRSAGSLHGQKPRDEVALRRSHRDLTAHRNSVAGDQVYPRDTSTPLSLGSVGTRRTVYLSEDDPPPPPVTQPPTNQTAPPLLVYNRISTVIGEPQQRNTSTLPSTQNIEDIRDSGQADRKKNRECQRKCNLV